jgi:transposase InsO family protein
VGELPPKSLPSNYTRSNKLVLLRPLEPKQYTSEQLALAATALDVRLSVGRRGQCWDFATIKNELTEHQTWPTHNALRRAVFDYIDGWYNTRRRHSSLGQLSPAVFEAGQEQIISKVA